MAQTCCSMQTVNRKCCHAEGWHSLADLAQTQLLREVEMRALMDASRL
jgi:hypothetical protein